MKQPDITVVIPTYKREEVLLNTIHDVLKQSYRNLELLVVDQTPIHKKTMRDAFQKITDPRFRYVMADPPSLPAARNFALKNARAPIVLFLDDDVELHEDMVNHHLEAFKSHPDVSAVGGRVLQKGFPIKKEVLKFDECAISHGVFTATEADYTNAFPGGNHSIKVADALSLGGFDTRFYHNAFREESDMSMKMIRAGMKIYYEPRAALTHLAAPSGGTREQTYTHIYDTAAFYENELYFTLRCANKRLKAFVKKYREYCYAPRSPKRMIRRSFLFVRGFFKAIWRQLFGKQIITSERSA